MGSRSTETVNLLAERERVLARLRGTLAELEERAPSMPSMPGKNLPKIASGSGGAGVALWVIRKAIKRARGKKQKETRSRKRAQPAPSVTVKVLPSGTALAIIGAAAIWAGIKYLEIQGRRGANGGATLHSMPARKGA